MRHTQSIFILTTRLFIEATLGRHLVVMYILYPRGRDVPATSVRARGGASGQSDWSVCTAQPQWRDIHTVGPSQV